GAGDQGPAPRLAQRQHRIEAFGQAEIDRDVELRRARQLGRRETGDAVHHPLLHLALHGRHDHDVVAPGGQAQQCAPHAAGGTVAEQADGRGQGGRLSARPVAGKPGANARAQEVIRSQKPRTPSTNVLDRGECRRAPSPTKVASNCSSSESCTAVRLTGVSTTTLQYRSPGARLRTDFTPLSRSRNTLPLWVSAGMRISASPPSVGTRTLSPSAAWEMRIGTSQ